jgi:hypothetical protein
MAQAIYHLYQARPTEAWHQLSREEQDQLFAKAGEALAQVGGKVIVLCNSRWASEQWPFWGVEQYPNIEAVQKHTELLNAFNWFRYMESMTVLGTELQPS